MIICGELLRMSSGDSRPEERSWMVVWWCNSVYCCIFCQTSAGWTDSSWGGVLFSFLFSYDKNPFENWQSFPLTPPFYLYRIVSTHCIAVHSTIVTHRYSTYTFSPWFQQRAGVLHRLISIPFTLSNGLASTGPIINKQKYADAAPTQRLGVLSGSRTRAGLWNRELLYLERTIAACIRGRGSAWTPPVTATCWQGSKEGRRSRALVRVGE